MNGIHDPHKEKEPMADTQGGSTNLSSEIWRMLLPVMIVSTLGLAGFGYFYVCQKEQTAEAAIVSKAESLAAYLQRASVASYQNYDLSAMEHTAQEVIKDKDFVGVVFYDDQKRNLTPEFNAKAPNLRIIELNIATDTKKELGKLKLAYRVEGAGGQVFSAILKVIAGVFLTELVVGWTVIVYARSMYLRVAAINRPNNVMPFPKKKVS
jgi:hypothetical protein